MDVEDLIEALLSYKLLVCVLAGVGAAAIAHQLMSPREPLLLEVLFVVGGFLGGVLWAYDDADGDEG